MSKRYTLGNKTYVFGKSKSTGMYAAWEQKKAGYVKIHECATIDEMKALSNTPNKTPKRIKGNDIGYMWNILSSCNARYGHLIKNLEDTIVEKGLKKNAGWTLMRCIKKQLGRRLMMASGRRRA